ncbi:rho guanine nucleotide exchange factor 18 cysts isoform X3 [Brevipalpus obovatus]|uniref:rho guanine nucleotide exchange factor 18 cysts isoform X3 n=1 Tax=Brevipalpus obovatus TaxID=246614 RepID=UPI003D9DCB8C
MDHRPVDGADMARGHKQGNESDRQDDLLLLHATSCSSSSEEKENLNDADGSVKIRVNDLTPSSSQEFIGSYGHPHHHRRPPTPSSLASTPKSPTPPSPMVSSSANVSPMVSPTGGGGGSGGGSVISGHGSIYSHFDGPTAKRCAKRNSAASFTAGNSSNNRVMNGSMAQIQIKRRKSWSAIVSSGEPIPIDMSIIKMSETEDIHDSKISGGISNVPGRSQAAHLISQKSMSMGSLDTEFEPIILLVPESRSHAASRDLSPSSISASHDDLAFGTDDLSGGSVRRRIRHPTEFSGGQVTQAISNVHHTTSCPHQRDPRSNSIHSVTKVSMKDDSLTSTTHHQYEKPRSLSASSTEAIFNSTSQLTCSTSNPSKSHSLHYRTPSPTTSTTSQSNTASLSRIQNSSSCIRSMSDITATDGQLDSCYPYSAKNGSNSSSRESVCATCSVSVYLTPPAKTTLHKSVSTPSILGAHESGEENRSSLKEKREKLRKSFNMLTSSMNSSQSTAAAEEEEEEEEEGINNNINELSSEKIVKNDDNKKDEKRDEDEDEDEQTPNVDFDTFVRGFTEHFQCSSDLLAATTAENLSYASNQESDDEKSISKRKKRGSLFFRKKKGKDKEKEIKKSPHQFVSVSFSIPALCDVCKKSLSNKTAIKCENCMVTVHDSSCKDQILDCNKFRLAKKPNHLALNTKDKTFSPMLQVPPGRTLASSNRIRLLIDSSGVVIPAKSVASGSKNSSPTSSVKEKKSSLSGFTKSSSSHGSSSESASSNTNKPSITGSSSPSSKVICEDKELDTGEDGHSNIIEANSGSMESLDESTQAEITTSIFEDDNVLRLLEEEPESWTTNVDKKILKRLKDKEIKRQEVIHELIITEKHHCLTLKIMQELYAQGMIKELHMTKDMVERIFPCLEDLLETHSTFLRKLRERQSSSSVIDNIGDIILDQFSGQNGEKMRIFYGQFCSQHKEALSLYKDILKTDRKFQSFVKKYCYQPLCKTRGIPECILLITQRITKYPLLIDSLIKTTRDTKNDWVDLKDAIKCIREIINRVDAQVAEKEKEIRLLQIYNRIDAKSTAMFKKEKFRKSDLLSNNRKLRQEFIVAWKSARGKIVDVIAVILSDVILLLQETNGKYHFCSLDNKSGVVALQKLLVREKAGQSSKGVYLISSNPKEPEMYELICPTAKEQKLLIEQIREAVDVCPTEYETSGSEFEEKKVEEARKAKVRELLNSMYEKDAKIAQTCEDKMKVFADIMELMGIETEGIDFIKYVPIMEENCSHETVLNVANEAFKIAHNLYISGTNLCRSVSSAGEHHSDAFVSPILPKRAETFGGFDNALKDQGNGLNSLKKKLIQLKDGTLGGTKECDSSDDKKGTESEINSSTSTLGPNTSQINVCPPSDTFLQIRGSGGDIRRSSGPLLGKCSSGTSSPEKIQRRSLVTTPTTSTQSLFSNITNTLAPTSPTLLTAPGTCPSAPTISSAILPLYDPSDIYRLSTTPLLMTQGKDQLIQIAELQHQVNLIMCSFNYQQSLFENMRYQLIESQTKLIQMQRENGSLPSGREGTSSLCSSTSSSFKGDRRSVYRPEQGLEELRNLQEQLRIDKSNWQKKLSEEKESLEEERKSLETIKQQIKQEQKDIDDQREKLYRKLEALQKEGIILSPAHTVVNTGNTRSINDNQASHNTAHHSYPLLSSQPKPSPPRPPPLPPLPPSTCVSRSSALSNNAMTESQSKNMTTTGTNSNTTPSLFSPRSSFLHKYIERNNNIDSNKCAEKVESNVSASVNSSPSRLIGQSIRQQLPLKLAVSENTTRCNGGQTVLVPSSHPISTTAGVTNQSR